MRSWKDRNTPYPTTPRSPVTSSAARRSVRPIWAHRSRTSRPEDQTGKFAKRTHLSNVQSVVYVFWRQPKLSKCGPKRMAERDQERIRKGQPAPPQLDVKIS